MRGGLGGLIGRKRVVWKVLRGGVVWVYYINRG